MQRGFAVLLIVAAAPQPTIRGESVFLDLDGASMRYTDEVSSEAYSAVLRGQHGMHALCSFGLDGPTVSKWIRRSEVIVDAPMSPAELRVGSTVLGLR